MSPVPVGDATPAFAVGGRPLEWRALEEAAAFEKWFERAASEVLQRAGAPRGHAGREMPGATGPATALRAPAGQGSAGRAMAPAAGGAPAVPAVDSGEAVRADRAGQVLAAAPGRAPGSGAAPMPAKAMGRAAGTPAHEADAPQWSRVAVTLVMGEREVRVWVRDYRLGPAEARQLRRVLLEEVALLGRQLAQFVVNGRSQYEAGAAPRGAPAQTPDSGY